MNDLCFACLDCKAYIDSGYRWCYWILEDLGIVKQGQSISIPAVLAATVYWRGGEDAEWLAVLLPKVKVFLEHHQDHALLYGETLTFPVMLEDDADTRWMEWLDEEGTSITTPREFRVFLGCTNWDQIMAQVLNRQQKDRPWWWSDTPAVKQVQAYFQS